jgi:hypothetical protein
VQGGGGRGWAGLGWVLAWRGDRRGGEEKEEEGRSLRSSATTWWPDRDAAPIKQCTDGLAGSITFGIVG